jgi:hypothetical protein
MKRIRYYKKEGLLFSKQNLVSEKTNALYQIIINEKERTFKIKNVKSERIVKEGGDTINNMNVLKRTIKKELKGLGVEFNLETRDRTFGLCEKGHNQKKELELPPGDKAE